MCSEKGIVLAFLDFQRCGGPDYSDHRSLQMPDCPLRLAVKRHPGQHLGHNTAMADI
jgi:hypothetical protein